MDHSGSDAGKARGGEWQKRTGFSNGFAGSRRRCTLRDRDAPERARMDDSKGQVIAHRTHHSEEQTSNDLHGEGEIDQAQVSEWRVSLYSSYSCAGALVAASRPLGGQLPREVRPYTIFGVSFCA